MIISLYLFDRILEFRLPNEVNGSFAFSGEDESVKLINVEEREGKWVLYRTSDVDVIFDNNYVDSIELVANNFYILCHENTNYLIYVSSMSGLKLNWYTFTSNLNMIIGNNSASNIIYRCPYLGNDSIKISQNNGILLLERTDNLRVYVNKKIIKTTQYYIRFGDEIEVYGLKLLFLKSYLFIKNTDIGLEIDGALAGISSFRPPLPEEHQDLEIKDVELYKNEDYFSKSPRLRRLIETKKIKLSAPPKTETGENMPLALVIGPMLTMGIMSSMTIITTITKAAGNSVSLSETWPQLVTGSVMLISTLVWPLVTQAYNKKARLRAKNDTIKKYNQYLEERKKELVEAVNNQKIILQENLINVKECINIINSRANGFWDKRIDQNDFLVVRIGMGDELLDCDIQYPDEGFTIEENELRKKADKLVEDFKYIKNVPIGYSFYENITTAVMGNEQQSLNFMNNVILQLVTFYSYEDLKIVTFTSEKDEYKWEYLKYLNHSFSNDKSFRFFSSNQESAKNIAEYLNFELSARVGEEGASPIPHYFIIIDGYDNVKNLDIIKTITEIENSVGFSLVILENRLGKLPSKCFNFISLSDGNSNLLKNSYEKQEQVQFKADVVPNINMMSLSKALSNIPIEFQEGFKELPNAVNFLEMEKVSKVEQLNIINRWNSNDSTASLKAEVGVDEQGNLMYLDLHEKFHGPHGLVAGMTGSGKSEFIITYILSMAINYDPDDVSFILIDYKGGGLAFAFENKEAGIILPHLAGTITNLDKAEMNRTLVSIDSEVKRRQRLFNEARSKLGESTIDIYKYQKFFKEGRIDEPISHLFIICDEFAELKSQQPDFMDNLISVARIGRSLGVHLILATQKPSGVVNDQIWSNTKFRVCLKVQDEQDSKEMLKRPDAASLTQAGRFYLQVGYNEYFALGQSGWCGAKYYPSDKIIKQVNKSIDFIDESANILKSIQASNNTSKLEAQGEQLGVILNSIIEASNNVNKKARKLWLDNVPDIISIEGLTTKYQIASEKFNIQGIIGEYDAPENQEQGIVTLNLLDDGNTAIYGNDGSEREMLLDALIYSTTNTHSVDEVNYYLIDYGSESLRKYSALPHFGGFVFPSEDEKFGNLLKLIKKELQDRKKLFVDYGGEYKNFIKSSGKTLPIKVFIFNNYDSIYESNQELYDELPDLTRDSERYGIVFIFTANASNSIQSKISQNIKNTYAYKLKDISDYMTVLGAKAKNMPKDIIGRGLLKQGDVTHEFQTAYILEDKDAINDFIIEFIGKQKEVNSSSADPIPTLPPIVRYKDVKQDELSIRNIPVAMSKKDLEVMTWDLLSNVGNIISSNRLINTVNFSHSFIEELHIIENTSLIIFDPDELLKLDKEMYPDYYTSDFSSILDKLVETLEKVNQEQTEVNIVIVIYGIAKFLTKIPDVSKMASLTKLLRENEKVPLIIADDASKIKKYTFEAWFTNLFTTNDGIWIGRGMSDQNLFHLTTITKDMTKDYKNDMGYVINESMATLSKFIDFISNDEEASDEE